MKTIDIIYGCSLRQVQGINFVNNSFVLGKHFFEDNGLNLGVICTNEEVFECKMHGSLDTIGVGMDTAQFKRKRSIREFAKILFDKRFLYGSLVKAYFNSYRPSKKAVKRYLQLNRKSEYILFQSVTDAYYFFKAQDKGLIEQKPKTVWMYHGPGDNPAIWDEVYPAIYKYKWISKRVFYDMVDYIQNRLDKVVFLSNRAVNACSWVSDEKKQCIYNGIQDLPSISLKTDSNKLEVVCVGSINYRKGQDVLLQSLEYLNNFYRERITINLVGDGAQRPELEEYVKVHQFDKYVKFWGVRNDVSEILKKMDVFVMMSKSEGMPMSIIEAERQGLFIVGTGVGAIPEMIRPEFGKCINRDAAELARTLSEILDNKLVNKSSREASRKFYEENLTLEANIRHFSEMFHSL